MQQVCSRGNLQVRGDIFFHHNDFDENRRIKAYTDNRKVYSMRIQVLQVTLLILVLLLYVTNFVCHASLQVEVNGLKEEVKELKSISLLLLNRHHFESRVRNEKGS